MKNLKALREEKSLSQQKLADILGLSQQSIYKYETQNVEPDIEMLIKMADYFETSIDYIVGYTELKHKIESTSAFDLNNDEAFVIEQYRLLPISSRKIITDLLSDLVNNIGK